MQEIERLRALSLVQQQQNESLSLKMKRKTEEMVLLSRAATDSASSPIEQAAIGHKRYILILSLSLSLSM